jgi:hypothetical protein
MTAGAASFCWLAEAEVNMTLGGCFMAASENAYTVKLQETSASVLLTGKLEGQ